jgi:hypothetical protein
MKRAACPLTLAVLSCCAAAVWPPFCVQAGQPAAPPPPQTIREEELARVERAVPKAFPWPTERAAKPANPAAPEAGSALPGFSGGYVIIAAQGEFTREEAMGEDALGKPAKKEVLTLNKAVEIMQVQSRSVLRANRIRATNDSKTGALERLEATGGVELVTPDQRASGESVTYQIKTGAQGQTLTDLYTLEGDRAKGKKAGLWLGENWIEADRFVNDRRLDTFRVIGGPAGVFNLPAPAAAPGDPKKGEGGMLSGLDVTRGGRISLSADGEMFYEGATGRLRISRNVMIQQAGTPEQPGITMNADDVILQMDLPPPGQAAPAGSLGGQAMLNGSLRSLEILGRVEIKSAPRTVLCDRAFVDMVRGTLLLEAKNPADRVRVYTATSINTGSVLLVPKNVNLTMATGVYSSGGPPRFENYTGTVPSPRSGENAAGPSK